MAGTYRGSRRVVGRYEAEDGREIVAATRVTVDAGGVVTAVGSDPDDLEDDPALVRSRDRRVVHYVSKVELAIRAKAWADRAITPDPKPKDRKRRRHVQRA